MDRKREGVMVRSQCEIELPQPDMAPVRTSPPIFSGPHLQRLHYFTRVLVHLVPKEIFQGARCDHRSIS